MIRRIVSQLVQQLGHRSITAENGLEGYELAAENRPDLIIMDIGFLNKPICKEELDQAIRDILGTE
jgi:DNA-binding response OmpR family regulator